MTKNEIIHAFADKNGYTITASTELYDAVCDFVREALIAGEELHIQGLGVFSTAVMPAKELYSIAQGKKVMYPEKRAPKFSYAPSLKKAVAEK
jgi:integration host factor subunit beta